MVYLSEEWLFIREAEVIFSVTIFSQERDLTKNKEPRKNENKLDIGSDVATGNFLLPGTSWMAKKMVSHAQSHPQRYRSADSQCERLLEPGKNRIQINGS